mmetsp:Transcript_60523/g.162358  ORF Transcript_60523/g.162358 Transcript_60523/m.162358 type:complete len:383 (-) Transcript_60523:921-2069(-)
MDSSSGNAGSPSQHEESLSGSFADVAKISATSLSILPLDQGDACQSHRHFCLWEVVVRELPLVVRGPRGHVEMTVTTEIEQHHLAVLGGLGRPNGSRHCVVGLGCRYNALGSREQRASLEALQLGNSFCLQFPELFQVGNQRGHRMVSQATRMRRRRHERVPEGVRLHQRRLLRSIPEIIRVLPLRQRRAARRLHGHHPDRLLGLASQLRPDVREAQAPEIRPTPGAPDQHIRVLPSHFHLLHGLDAGDGLVQQDVVQHAAQGVLVVLHGGGSLAGLGDGNPERPWAVRVLLQDLLAHLSLLGRRRVASGAPRLHHRAAIGLLVVGDLHLKHFDRDVEDLARKRQRAPPLPSPGLRTQLLRPRLLVVECLRNRRVGLVTAGR